MVGMEVDLASLPYRCPRCEEKADFPTLEALRRHLADNHSYSRFSRVKPTRPRTSSTESPGRTSPLTESFLRQRHLLEEQLKLAKLKESTSHLDSQGYHDHSRDIHKYRENSRNSEHGTSMDSHSVSRASNHDKTCCDHQCHSLPNYDEYPSKIRPVSQNEALQPETANFVEVQIEDMERQRNLSNGDSGPISVEHLARTTPRFRTRCQRRSHDVPVKTATQRDMTEALAHASNHMDSMKQKADHVVQQQAALIEVLRQELKTKDERLDTTRKQLSVLHGDRQRLLIKVSKLSREQDQSADNIAQLKSRVAEQEKQIEDKQKEVGVLSGLIQGTSRKERAAKDHLEKHIQELTSRAERAEAALMSLGHSSAAEFSGFYPSSSKHVELSDSAATVISVGSPKGNPLHRLSGHVVPMHTSSKKDQKEALKDTADQVNHYAGSSLSYPMALLRPTPRYAPPTAHQALPTLTSLIVETPPFTPPNIGSPIRTGSTSSEQSMFATSGYLSQTTLGCTPSSVPYANQMEKVTSEDSRSKKSLSVTQSVGPNSVASFGYSGVLSPLSPGEVIVNQPHWFKPLQNEEEQVNSGRGQEEEGLESGLNDSQQALSEHRAQGTLSYLASSVNYPRVESSGEISGYFHQPSSTGSHLQLQSQRLGSSWDPAAGDAQGHTVCKEELSSAYNLTINGKTTQSRQSVRRQDKAHNMQEALNSVFQYLDTPALCVVSQVCRDWRDLSRQPSLWRKVCLHRAAVSSKFLKTISRWCTDLQSLTLEGLFGRTRRSSETAEEYKKSIRGSLESGLEVLLAAARDSLLSLRIVDCGPLLTDRCLWLASSSSRSLQRLAYLSDSDPAGSEVIWALGAGCRQLQTLIIPPKYPSAHPHRYNDRCLTLTASCWPQLLVLCVGGVEISVKGLVAVAKTCTRLKVLELDHVCEVTEEMAVAMCRQGFRGLHTLHFSSTPVTPRALLHFVSSCASLQTVHIHISIADYFRDTEDSENQRHYRDVINKLKLVQNRPGMREVIHIEDRS